MKRLIAVLACLAVALAAPLAHHTPTFTPPDLDGCQEAISFAWGELRPGETWRETIDLSACQDLPGRFVFYGYEMGDWRKIKGQSKVDLFVDGRGMSRQAIYISHTATEPALVEVMVVNGSRKTIGFRTSWVRID